jgi:hypothetical protein
MRAMFPKDHRRNIQPIPPYIAQTEQRFHLASAHPMRNMDCSGKGTSFLFHIFRGLRAQRRDSLYKFIIGDPAFETPEQAAKWRKDQLKDNRLVAELANAIDEAMANCAENVNLLHSPFPVSDFRPVKAKVKGSRYFAQLYVRVESDETPIMALQRILGDEMEDVEVK